MTRLGIVAISIALGGARLAAQGECTATIPIAIGSEWERYLRVAQVSGALDLEPWSLRAFSPVQQRRLAPTDTSLPWTSRPVPVRSWCAHGRWVAAGPINAQLVENSGFPLGENDGAVWAGRGLTAAADALVAGRIGPLTLVLAPIAFVSQNAAFALRPNGLSGRGAFADWRNPGAIDLPQRFGAGAYATIDPGQSEVRLDAYGASVGVSTANQFWGPATDFPLILGNNAAGLPRLFAGTSEPVRLWKLGAVHTQMFWGASQPSPYAPPLDSNPIRMASGIVAVFQPGGMRGVELGGTRFFHMLRDRFVLHRSDFTLPFSFLLRSGNSAQQQLVARGDNQLASVFARFVSPSDGMEIYAEFGREDYSASVRQFLQFPDHDSGYLIGGRKVWRRPHEAVSLRAEVLNTRITNLGLSSSQAPWYVHGQSTQGHTQRGQLLGAVNGYGGGGSVVALDRYDRDGRFSVEWERMVTQASSSVASDPFTDDVTHILRLSQLRFGRLGAVETSVAAVYEINRRLYSDAFAVQAAVRVSSAFRQ